MRTATMPATPTPVATARLAESILELREAPVLLAAFAGVGLVIVVIFVVIFVVVVIFIVVMIVVVIFIVVMIVALG